MRNDKSTEAGRNAALRGTCGSIAIYLLTVLISMSTEVFAQPIHLYSIAAVRQPSGDAGYTLDGRYFRHSRSILVSPAYYGPGGYYSRPVVIHDTFAAGNSLTGITRISTDAIFFLGWFDKGNATTAPFTRAELDSIMAWSLRGGRVINTSGLGGELGMDGALLNSRYGFEMTLGSSESLVGNAADPAGTPFNGPWGLPNNLPEGGSLQGYYSSIPDDHAIFARDGAGRPTMFMDCRSMDVMVADVDVFSDLSQLLFNQNGIADTDRLLGNLIHFMGQLPVQPVVTANGHDLSASTGYSDYQWYKDGLPVDKATGSSLNASGDGTFQVGVMVHGCRVKSAPVVYSGGSASPVPVAECDVVVPTAFSPDGNGVNELACVYGSCWREVDFRVFDRWGEMVFRSVEQDDCWDGMHRGKMASPGVYAWTVDAKTASGVSVKKSGHITLVR